MRTSRPKPFLTLQIPSMSENKIASSNRGQPGTKSASRLVDKPRINRRWTGCQSRVHHWFCFSVSLNGSSLVRASERTLKRSLEEPFFPERFDPLEGSVNLSFPDEYFCGHPILRDPARPFRRASRPDSPAICSGFWFERFPFSNKLRFFEELALFRRTLLCLLFRFEDWRTSVIRPLEGVDPLERATLSREPPRGGSQHPTNQTLPSSLLHKNLENLCPYPLPPPQPSVS